MRQASGIAAASAASDYGLGGQFAVYTRCPICLHTAAFIRSIDEVFQMRKILIDGLIKTRYYCSWSRVGNVHNYVQKQT